MAQSFSSGPASLPAKGKQPTRGPTNRWSVTRALERDPLPFLLEMTSRYGDVVRLPQLPLGDMYLINHPDGIRQVLQDHAPNYRRDPHENRLFERFVGQSILSTDGELWMRLRRLEQPAFSKQHVVAVTGHMVEAIGGALETWPARSGAAESLDLIPAVTSLTLAVLAKTLYSLALSSEEVSTIATSLKTINAYALALFLYPFLPYLGPLSARNRRARSAQHALDDVVLHLIQQRRTLLEQAAPPNSPGDQQRESTSAPPPSHSANHPTPVPEDLLTFLLQRQEEDGTPAFSNPAIRNETLSLLIAGHENATSLLCWAWYLLSTHPEVCERLHDEVSRVLCGRAPTAGDLPKLPYTRQVLEEALRLYPPAWLFPRQAIAADTIGGYLIPKGATVLLCPYTTHHHPAFWPDPEVFDPERFSARAVNERPRYCHYPFGGGQHQCLGATFAMQEAHLALAMMAQRYRFTLEPGFSLHADARVTLRPRELPMRLSLR